MNIIAQFQCEYAITHGTLGWFLTVTPSEIYGYSYVHGPFIDRDECVNFIEAHNIYRVEQIKRSAQAVIGSMKHITV